MCITVTIASRSPLAYQLKKLPAIPLVKYDIAITIGSKLIYLPAGWEFRSQTQFPVPVLKNTSSDHRVFQSQSDS